jgi:hypothetical protein
MIKNRPPNSPAESLQGTARVRPFKGFRRSFQQTAEIISCIGKLAARFVETVSKPGLYGDGANLYFKVDASGARSWIFRWEIGGGKVPSSG